jgi:hypothetical protein
VQKEAELMENRIREFEAEVEEKSRQEHIRLRDAELATVVYYQ